MIAPLFALVLWMQAAASAREAGLTAYKAGRYEEAARLLQEVVATENDYEALVALGVSLGKLGRNAEATAAFDRAISLDAGRPEARVERGGLRFIEHRYDDAVRDLEGALAIRKDGYTRNLLASSYHLVGRSEDALREWNELGQPVLGETTLTGFGHIHAGVARRELTLRGGEMLDVDGLRESRLRLQEVGVFSRVVLRPVPRQEGRADLEVAVHERHAFGSIPEFVGTAAGNALVKKVRLRYFGLFGSAINVGAQYRWEKSRPKKSVSLDWARFLGIQELGLPYASDPAASKHLARFLHRQVGAVTQQTGGSARPTAVLFNGGVFKAMPLRRRLLEILNEWTAGGAPVKELAGTDLDHAVAGGAAYYGMVRRGKGVRIRGCVPTSATPRLSPRSVTKTYCRRPMGPPWRRR